MIDRASAEGILSTLGFVVLTSGGGGSLRLESEGPEWLSRFLPGGPGDIEEVELVAAFPLLETFLATAGEFWATGETDRLRSGPWVQADRSGREAGLEASAMVLDGRKLLLLELLGETFEERRAALQYARDKALAFERLDRHAQTLASESKQLVERTEEAERLSELKSDFLASMSHELRTPLNAIIGFSKLLAEEQPGPLNDKQQRFLQRVTEAADHLLALINDILDLSKIEAGREELRCNYFRFSDVAGEVLASVRPMAAEKRIDLQVQQDTDQAIYGDRTRFRQILYNLLSNAIKFSLEGGTVGVEAVDRGSHIAVSVRDNGVGVPPPEREAIFEKFYQAANSGNAKGTGLGLAITKKLVELHGGQIWVDEAPGGGSIFTVELPQGPRLEEGGSKPARRPERLAEGPSRGRLRVAVVEDDDASSSLLTAILEDCCRVSVYESGEDALRGFQHERPEVVLLDISLPGISGREVLRVMRSDERLRAIPAVAISAHAMDTDVEAFRQDGFDGYFTKPITNPSGLVQTIRKLGSLRS